MRPLMERCGTGTIDAPRDRKSDFETMRHRLQSEHHANCAFRTTPPVEGARFSFRDDGSVYAHLTFDECHQGYDGMAHGGFVAAVVDASMAQCLMGHGVVAYTADLRLSYKKPVAIEESVELYTCITEMYARKLYRMETTIYQNEMLCVKAQARFFRIQ